LNRILSTKCNEIESEIIDYIAKNGKATAKELAERVGVSIPSIRYHVFQLMAKQIVGQERSRKHRVWWFLQDDGKDKFETTEEENE